MLMPIAAAAAAADAPAVEITPFGAYRFGGTFDVEGADSSYELEDSSSYGLLVNFRHQANTQWEILYSRQETEAEFSDATIGALLVDVDVQMLQGGGIYQWDGDAVLPFLSLTLGGTRIRISSATGEDSDTFWSASIGAGLKIRPNERLGLRLEARAYGTFVSSSTDLFCQTGPDANVCAVRIDSTMLRQIETLAGVTFRF
ncbi:MAG: outer membrane protein [Woeseiaceae bacterium]